MFDYGLTWSSMVHHGLLSLYRVNSKEPNYLGKKDDNKLRADRVTIGDTG